MIPPPTAEDLRRDLEADYADLHASLPVSLRDLLSAIRLAAHYRAIVETPAAALFVGREPTTNERHLLSLLSWRESENRALKEELRLLRGERTS